MASFKSFCFLTCLVLIASFGYGATTITATTESFENQVLRSIIQALQPFVQNGIPELGVPSLDPATLGPFALDLNEAFIKVALKAENGTLSGISDFYLDSVSKGPTTNQFLFQFSFPKIILASDTYSISGTVAAIIPCNGSGKMVAEGYNVKATGLFSVATDGTVALTDFWTYLDVGSASVHLQGLISLANSYISNNAPTVLKQNRDSIAMDIRVLVLTKVNSYLQHLGL